MIYYIQFFTGVPGKWNAVIVDRKVDTSSGSMILLSLQWGTDQDRSNSEDRLEKVSIKTKDLGTGSSGEIGRESCLWHKSIITFSDVQVFTLSFLI